MDSATQAGYGVKYKADPSTLYLVDPQGGRYKLVTWSARNPRANWGLAGWSGDVSRALFVTSRAVVTAGREHLTVRRKLRDKHGRIEHIDRFFMTKRLEWTREVVASRKRETP